MSTGDSDPGPRLQRLNEYLERNFPDFFAEARFQVGTTITSCTPASAVLRPHHRAEPRLGRLTAAVLRC